MEPHTALLGHQHQADVAHQRVPDPQGPDRLQPVFQLGHLPVVDDPGEHHPHPAPVGQALAQPGVGGQNVQGDVEHTYLAVQEGLRQLLPGGDLDRQPRQACGALEIGNVPGLFHGMLLPPGTQGRHLVQHIPAHTVDGGGGEHQPRIHIGLDRSAAEGCAAGFGHPGGKHLLAEGHIHGPLRPGALGHGHVAVGILCRQAAAVYGDGGLEFQIHQGHLHALVALADGLQKLGVLRLILVDAEHPGGDLP